MKHNFHIFRENAKLNMQDNFIFVDTETNCSKNKNVKELTFKLGSLVYWEKANNIIERKNFFELKDFWNYVESKIHDCKKLILFAHNTDFDFKILDGYNYLINRDWKVKNWYIQGRTFIIKFTKDDMILNIWDTMNYVPVSLKELGETVGLKKLEIDFNKVSRKELLVYCQRDTEIIFKFIQKLISFLEEYELSKLMPTSASLSLNIFRHKFYNKKEKPVFIHDWKNTIKLERDSYGGGISDCFKIGKINEKVYKLDINSMYPFIMRNKELPIKLIFWSRKGNYSEQELNELYNKFKRKYHSIIRCKIKLPKKFAYILQKTEINKQPKSIFLAGEFNTVLTTPELNFVEEHGKIIKIYEIAFYEKRIIFKDFVDFFYEKRLKFKEDNNSVNEQFCKLILNSQYGKWGQKQIKYTLLKESKKCLIKYYGTVIDAELDKSYQLIQFGYKIFKIEQLKENSKDSFVAISSFITAYSRMLLVNYILKAKRENTFYCDTDSLFINQTGYDNLKEYIDKDKLGSLKLEATTNNLVIYRPKFYFFNDKLTCKGIKKNSKIIKETKNKISFPQERWERFKTSLANEHLDKQIMTLFIKTIKKGYDKGFIDKNKCVQPYVYNKGVY